MLSLQVLEVAILNLLQSRSILVAVKEPGLSVTQHFLLLCLLALLFLRGLHTPGVIVACLEGGWLVFRNRLQRLFLFAFQGLLQHVEGLFRFDVVRRSLFLFLLFRLRLITLVFLLKVLCVHVWVSGGL